MKKILLLLILLQSSAAHGEIFKWIDRGGTAHYSNSMDDVPERYRSRVKQMNYGVGQKSETASQQSVQGVMAETASGDPSFRKNRVDDAEPKKRVSHRADRARRLKNVSRNED
jgi:hypothetical protein